MTRNDQSCFHKRVHFEILSWNRGFIRNQLHLLVDKFSLISSVQPELSNG